MNPPPDAISLTSTPSNLPPLPTGTFAITLDEPTAVKNSCLTNNQQACAWDCATGARLNMAIQMAPSGPMVSLSYPQPPNPPIRYGAQPPQLQGELPLVLMGDRYASSKGPAYLFTQQYNKTVILHSTDLPGGLQNSKRSFLPRWFSQDNEYKDSAKMHRRDSDDSDWTDNSIAVPTDKPWYCYWPGTILEGFIYITEDSDSSDDNSEASSGAAAVTAGSSSPSQTVGKRQAPSSLPQYPKVVKIEERRNSINPIKPYCQQMQILNTNMPGPLTDPGTGQLIQVQLEESESIVQHQFAQPGSWGQAAPSAFPSFPATPTGPSSRRRALDRRDSSGASSACQCEWMNDS